MMKISRKNGKLLTISEKKTQSQILDRVFDTHLLDFHLGILRYFSEQFLQRTSPDNYPGYDCYEKGRRKKRKH